MKKLSTLIDTTPFINECIIVAKKFNDGFVLAKNRDRPYDPSLTIIHEIVNGTEIAYALDNDTDWSEGMNEFGIAIINSALMVSRDEAEKKIVKKKSTKLKDGSIIREALQYSDIDKVIEIIQNKSGGLKGHTFIAIHDKLYALELTSRHNAELIELSNEDLVVRTNHGVSHTTAGYQAGLSYKSSAIRKQTAQKQMAKTTTPESMLDNLRTAFYKKDSQLNMKRDTKTLWTSSQILLDTNNLVLVLAAFKNKTTQSNIENRLPANYKAKISIKLEQI
jgi:hypothetical protein